MNPAEAAVLLAAVSANDNREVTESASRAWAAALPDVELQDALDYLPSYYRTATRDGRNWVYPGDVLTGVIELHKERRAVVAREAHDQAIASAGDIDEMERDLLARRAQVEAAKRYDAEHKRPSSAASADQARVMSMLGIRAS